jgi:hypothetical protein
VRLLSPVVSTGSTTESAHRPAPVVSTGGWCGSTTATALPRSPTACLP